MSVQKLMAFMQDPRNHETLHWMDEETRAFVTLCEKCGVEVRHAEEELSQFRFEHQPTCPTQCAGISQRQAPTRGTVDSVSKLPRAGGVPSAEGVRIRDQQCYALATVLAEVIDDHEVEQEMDVDQILSTLSFLSAVTCLEGGLEEGEAVGIAMTSFTRHLDALGGARRAGTDALAVQLSARKNPDHPDIMAGVELGRDVLKVIEKADAPVALVALQSAAVEKILSTDLDHGAVATGCANGIREEVLRRTPWKGHGRSSTMVH